MDKLFLIRLIDDKWSVVKTTKKSPIGTLRDYYFFKHGGGQFNIAVTRNMCAIAQVEYDPKVPASEFLLGGYRATRSEIIWLDSPDSRDRVEKFILG